MFANRHESDTWGTAHETQVHRDGRPWGNARSLRRVRCRSERNARTGFTDAAPATLAGGCQPVPTGSALATTGNVEATGCPTLALAEDGDHGAC